MEEGLAAAANGGVVQVDPELTALSFSGCILSFHRRTCTYQETNM
jgi:hypothetical protein